MSKAKRHTVDLSIVIITWRMRDFLGNLLTSIYRYTKGVRFEVIVVDNNSDDGTAEMVKSRFPQVSIVRNDRNRGVAAARNQAFRLAKGKHVMTLDADTLLTENSFKKMVDFIERTPDAGVCGCKLVFPDATVQPSGRKYPTILALIFRRLKRFSFAVRSEALRNHEMAEWHRADTRAVDYVIGACQIIRRRAMDEVGMLDDRIFYGPEDIDYCLRMYEKGWKVYYFPKTQIIHYEQRMTKRNMFSKISLFHLFGLIYLFGKYRGKLSPRRSGR